MALLHAAGKARRHARFPRLRALTIDHALRPEAAGETRFVGEACARIGITHDVVRLDWTPPRSAIQARAREERLEAFRHAMAGPGRVAVLTAHTADDQAETMWMREARGSLDGQLPLGMPPALHLHTGWLHRPFLGLRREALRAWARETGADWIEDSSNADRRFERVRARDDLLGRDDEVRRLLALARASAETRRRESEAAASLLERHFVHDPRTGTVASRDPVPLDRPGALRCYAAVIGHVGGAERLPGRGRVRRALERVGEPRADGQGRRAASLSGAVIRSAAHGARYVISRERRGAARVGEGSSESTGVRGSTEAPLHPWPRAVPLHDLALADALARLVRGRGIGAPELRAEAWSD